MSVCPQEGLCMMSLPVWLPGPMFLLGGALCLWSHVLSAGSLSRGISVQGNFCPGGLYPGGLCPGESLSRGSLSRRGLSPRSLCQADPQTETPTETPQQRPPYMVKSGRYASYWNAFLLTIEYFIILF